MFDRLKRWWFYAITVGRDPTEPRETFMVYIVRRWSGERVTYTRCPLSLLSGEFSILPLAQGWCWNHGIPPICVSVVEKELRKLAKEEKHAAV